MASTPNPTTTAHRVCVCCGRKVESDDRQCRCTLDGNPAPQCWALTMGSAEEGTGPLELGWAQATNPRNLDELTLTTPNGLTLTAVATDLTEAGRLLALAGEMASC